MAAAGVILVRQPITLLPLWNCSRPPLYQLSKSGTQYQPTGCFCRLSTTLNCGHEMGQFLIWPRRRRAWANVRHSAQQPPPWDQSGRREFQKALSKPSSTGPPQNCFHDKSSFIGYYRYGENFTEAGKQISNGIYYQDVKWQSGVCFSGQGPQHRCAGPLPRRMGAAWKAASILPQRLTPPWCPHRGVGKQAASFAGLRVFAMNACKDVGLCHPARPRAQTANVATAFSVATVIMLQRYKCCNAVGH